MIDILLAAYNGERYIKQQIESILNQSYKEWRLIIKDDRSTDNTLEIIKEFASLYPDKIMFVESKVNSGSAKKNFMSMLELTKEDYIMFSDQDDIWLPDKVKITLKTMKKLEQKCGEGNPLLVHGDLIVVDEELNTTAKSMFYIQNLDSKKVFFSDLLVQNNITGCTMMINRALINKITELPDYYIMHDWWFGLIASAFGKIEFMNNRMIQYRQHSSNVEGAKNIRTAPYLIKKALAGTQVKETLVRTYKQAAEFHRIYYQDLDNEKKCIIDAYMKLPVSSKINKIRILKKYKFTKSGLFRKIGYYFYI